MLSKQRAIKRLGYKLKRALKSSQEPEPKKIATLADIQGKVKHYESTMGRANFTGPQLAKEKAE